MRATQAHISLSALRHNVELVRQLAPASRLMAVVKADAYGHGALTMARALEPHVDALAVACIEEALELYESGITTPILLLQGVFEPQELELAASIGAWVNIHSKTQLGWLEAAHLQCPLQCWLKIDTGMHRLGIAPASTGDFYHRLEASANSQASPVLSTHFASADGADRDFTLAQIQQFEQATVGLVAQRSAANSAGTLAFPEAHYEWIRPGYMLWGNSPFGTAPHEHADQLRPVMTLQSVVTAVRDVPAGEQVGYSGHWRADRPSRIATVTAGYGDGYPRTARNGTPVLVNGQRCPLAGRVSMDMLTVDVTDIGPVVPGDPVTLWGEGLPAAEVAACADTIGYELLTRMPARPPRVIRDED